VNNNHSAIRVGSSKRRRFSPQQIQQLLAQFERSGLSASAFTRQHGLCYSVFCRWRKRHCALARRPPRLQAVPLGSLFAAAWMAEIALPNGATLRLNPQASPAWSAELLRTLVRSC
jgi:transposase-like protein